MGSRFSVRESKKWVDMGFSIKKDGMLSNFTDDTNQLMNGDKPWRGAREKNDHFLSIIFDTITQEGDIVMDWHASTGISCLIPFLSPCSRFTQKRFFKPSELYLPGASIAACRSSGRHIVAVERDTEIFNAVLLPLRDLEPPSQRPESSRHRPPTFEEPMQKKQRRHALCA